ncbi:regulatory factor X-associated protein [Echinops telfairi]|uniref:Regulatory factor X-associated protein n=1 Tax=Echinops telfairi TaxID=9371 RepID=A0ABM1VIZ1_ECHTE|nr:regulatory factor X-associated protein [Echinops telfairi]
MAPRVVEVGTADHYDAYFKLVKVEKVLLPLTKQRDEVLTGHIKQAPVVLRSAPPPEGRPAHNRQQAEPPRSCAGAVRTRPRAPPLPLNSCKGRLSPADADADAAGVVEPGAKVSSTEVQGVAEGPGRAAAGSACPGAPAAPGPAPAPAPPLTLLVMHPCGGQEETAAVLRPAAGHSVRYLCDLAGDGEEEAGDDEAEADLLDTSDPPGGGESAASLEDLEDEDPQSGGEGSSGGGARRRGGGASKTCTYEGCRETTNQVAKQRKPWMCKKHRNKMYKDKYKKKKSDQALNCGGTPASASAGNVKLEESADSLLSIVKQRTGSFGDRPARPTLLEQVLNQKRLSLLRSPEVVQFLQKQQQLLSQQVLEQRQQPFPGAPV